MSADTPAGERWIGPDHSPAYQDEYQRLWHEASKREKRLRDTLTQIRDGERYGEAAQRLARAELAPAPSERCDKPASPVPSEPPTCVICGDEAKEVIYPCATCLRDRLREHGLTLTLQPVPAPEAREDERVWKYTCDPKNGNDNLAPVHRPPTWPTWGETLVSASRATEAEREAAQWRGSFDGMVAVEKELKARVATLEEALKRIAEGTIIRDGRRMSLLNIREIAAHALSTPEGSDAPMNAWTGPSMPSSMMPTPEGNE